MVSPGKGLCSELMHVPTGDFSLPPPLLPLPSQNPKGLQLSLKTFYQGMTFASKMSNVNILNIRYASQYTSMGI